MERFNMQSESFDFGSDEDIRRAKNKKNFKIALISTVTILLIVIVTFIISLIVKNAESKKAKMNPVYNHVQLENLEININRPVLVEYQAEIVKDKTLLYATKSRIINNNYIKNITIEVYTDGTYFENIVETQNGHYQENRIMGTIDIKPFEDYILEQREVLLTKELISDEEDHDMFDVGTTLINVKNKYRLLYDDIDDVYIEDLMNIFNDTEKEIVQDYFIEDI